MTPESKVLDTGMTLPSPEELERAMRAGNRERAEMAGVLWREVTGMVLKLSQGLARRLQSTAFSARALIASLPNPTASR